MTNDEVVSQILSYQSEIDNEMNNIRAVAEKIGELNNKILEAAKPEVARLAAAGAVIRAWQIVSQIKDNTTKQALCDIIFQVLDHKNSKAGA